MSSHKRHWICYICGEVVHKVKDPNGAKKTEEHKKICPKMGLRIVNGNKIKP